MNGAKVDTYEFMDASHTLQDRSEEILCLGILNHTLVAFPGTRAQTIKNKF